MLATLYTGDYVLLVVYLAVVVGIGFLFSKGQKTTSSFFLASRSLPWPVVAISYVITLLSTLSLVAIPGELYNYGLTLILANLLAPVFIILGFFVFMRYFFTLKSVTPFEYLEHRFDSRVRNIAAIVYWLSRMFYLAIVLLASAKVFKGAADWNISGTILILGATCVAYTVLGGQKAVIYNDLLQFLVLVGGLGMVCYIAIGQVPGGAWGVVTTTFEQGHGLKDLTDPTFYGLDASRRLNFWMLILGLIYTSIFYNSVDQIAIQRLLSSKSYGEAKRSMFTASIVQIPLVMCIWFMGMTIFSYYTHQPPEVRPESGDLALFQFIGNNLPTPMPGLVLAAMLAAAMSTISSGIHSQATVAVNDIFRTSLAARTEEYRYNTARAFTVGIGILATGVALFLGYISQRLGESMIETAAIWGPIAGALPGVFMLGIFSRRASARDAYYCMLFGIMTTVGLIVTYMLTRNTDYALSFQWVGVPALPAVLILGLILSRTSSRLDNDRIQRLTLRRPFAVTQ